MSESGGTATLTATLSSPTNQAVSITFKPAGTATYWGDYGASFVEKDEGTTVSVGKDYGSTANQLYFPNGIYVNFVADNGNHRIPKVQYQPQIVIAAGQTSYQWFNVWR